MGGHVSRNELEHGVKDTNGVLVVVGIEFGTSNAGYAFSLVRNQSQIHTGKCKNKLQTDREPTTVLLKPDGSFDSFGFKALENYCKLSKSEQNEYYFFRAFEMELHNKSSFSKDTKIKDIHKKEFPAFRVLSYVIEYLKSLALSVMREETDLKETDIFWMLSIPTIWSQSARHFMRKAAKHAGINKDKIRLVLETEAASMYCRERLMIATNSASIDQLPVGYKYILAYSGGSTADICAHEIIGDGKLRELYRASGGDYGGNKVDLEFYKFMINLVGGPVWTLFEENHMLLYLDFLKEFETKKKAFKADDQVISLKLENAVLEILKSETGETIDQMLPQMSSRYKEKVKFKSVDQRLELNGEIMADLFKSSVDGFIETLNKVIQKCPVDVKTLLLVGGFAESPYLREKIKAKFGNLNILLEQDSRLAVMKGAVLLGYTPNYIVERKAVYTYGYSEVRDFDRQRDPEELKVKGDDGKEYCDAHFKRVIEKGQLLKNNDKIETSVNENRRNRALKHRTITIELWQSEHRDPKYCWEEEKCSRVAEIVMYPPPDGWPDRLKIIRILDIKETEFKITVKIATTGIEYKTKHTF